MSDLVPLRKKMDSIYLDYFLLLEKRRLLVREIASAKNKSEELKLKAYPHFDIIRERELFARFQDRLQDMSFKEVLSLSLIIEDQACLGTDMFEFYPQWSKQVHSKGLLDNELNPLIALINPVILFFHSEDLFAKLEFKEEFEHVREFLFS